MSKSCGWLSARSRFFGAAAGATTVIIADHGASSDDPAQLEAHMSISHLSELLKLFESEETAL
jgi:hypothetical protein